MKTQLFPAFQLTGPGSNSELVALTCRYPWLSLLVTPLEHGAVFSAMPRSLYLYAC
jgi:hypothetical protein